MAPSPTLAAVTACFDGLRNKNADDVPFAPDVRFESPLSDPIQGAGAVREFIGMAAATPGLLIPSSS